MRLAKVANSAQNPAPSFSSTMPRMKTGESAENPSAKACRSIAAPSALCAPSSSTVCSPRRMTCSRPGQCTLAKPARIAPGGTGNSPCSRPTTALAKLALVC